MKPNALNPSISWSLRYSRKTIGDYHVSLHRTNNSEMIHQTIHHDLMLAPFGSMPFDIKYEFLSSLPVLHDREPKTENDHRILWHLKLDRHAYHLPCNGLTACEQNDAMRERFKEPCRLTVATTSRARWSDDVWSHSLTNARREQPRHPNRARHQRLQLFSPCAGILPKPVECNTTKIKCQLARGWFAMKSHREIRL